MFAGNFHITVRAAGGARQAQHRVAFRHQTVRDRVQKPLAYRIAGFLAASRSGERQREPFADNRHMAALKQRQRRLLKARQVLPHQRFIAVGAAAPRACHQNQFAHRRILKSVRSAPRIAAA